MRGAEAFLYPAAGLAIHSSGLVSISQMMASTPEKAGTAGR
jgi:hypothetical protein